MKKVVWLSFAIMLLIIAGVRGFSSTDVGLTGSFAKSIYPKLDSVVESFINTTGLHIDSVEVSFETIVNSSNRQEVINKTKEQSLFLNITYDSPYFTVLSLSEVDQSLLDFSLLNALSIEDFLNKTIVDIGDTVVRLTWSSTYSSPSVFQSLAVLNVEEEPEYDSFMFFVATEFPSVTEGPLLSSAHSVEKTYEYSAKQYNTLGWHVATANWRIRWLLSIIPSTIPTSGIAAFQLRGDFTLTVSGISLGKHAGLALGYNTWSTMDVLKNGPYDSYLRLTLGCAKFHTGKKWQLTVHDNQKGDVTSGSITVGPLSYGWSQEGAGAAPYVSLFWDNERQVRIIDAVRSNGHGVFIDAGSYILVEGYIQCPEEACAGTLKFLTEVHRCWVGWNCWDSYEFKCEYKHEIEHPYQCANVTFGGEMVLIDKFGLLAPYIALASTILVATAATAIYIKHTKRRKKKQ